ncbi:MAG: hypothetical protein WC444_07110 [Candidatus Paceibacterota bacterium]
MRLDLYHNPSKEDVLKAIGLTESDIPRFRGAGVDGDRICVHTRTGGGNREYYAEANNELRKNPYYLCDEDDDFDCTYANFWFKIPEEHKEIRATENKEAKAVYGDAPTAIGVLFGDKEAIKKAQENLDELKDGVK